MMGRCDSFQKSVVGPAVSRRITRAELSNVWKWWPPGISGKQSFLCQTVGHLCGNLLVHVARGTSKHKMSAIGQWPTVKGMTWRGSGLT